MLQNLFAGKGFYPGLYLGAFLLVENFPWLGAGYPGLFANKYLYNYNDIMKYIKPYGIFETFSADLINQELGAEEMVTAEPDWAGVRGYLYTNRDKVKTTLEKAIGDKFAALVAVKACDIYAEDRRDGVTPNPDWYSADSIIVDEDYPDLQDWVKTVIDAIRSSLAKSDPATLTRYITTGKGVKTSRV